MWRQSKLFSESAKLVSQTITPSSKQRVGFFHEARHSGIAGAAEIGAADDVGRGPEQSAAHEGRHHRQAEPARQRGDPRLDAVAPNLHIHHQDGSSGGGQLRNDLVRAFGERGGIGDAPRQHRDGSGRGSHHVARQLDIDRERALARAAQDAGDLLRSGCRIGEDRLIAGDLLEYGELGVDCPRLVMQQQAAGAFARPRRAGDDDHRGALGIGAGDRVDEVEGAAP